MVQSTPVLYVNPAIGNDAAVGSQTLPFKTLTQALRQAKAGITIQLARGTYSAANGEVFPLVVPAGVTIVGNAANKGEGILIEGSGEYVSPTFARQNVTLQPGNDAQVQGVTLTNRAVRGTAIWIESTAPVIASSTFINCGREGILATGTANPLIIDSVFIRNAASGISIVRNAKGEIRRNLYQKTGYGIAISDHAAPLVADNRAIENRSGIVLSGEARPVLRNNVVEKNTSDGLVVTNKALPDMGGSQDPGGNVLRDNGGFDLQNSTAKTLTSVGNQLNPVRVKGAVTFAANQVPGPIATPLPSPTPVPTPLPSPSPDPSPTSVQFPDIRGHWAIAFIQGLVNRGVFSGFADGTFRPDAKITRAQFAAACVKSFKLPAKRQPSHFIDVSADFWAHSAIAQVDQMGLMSGYPDGTFRPNQNLTRIQAIVSLVSGLGLTGGSQDVLLLYRDRAQIPSYATAKVATATQRQIVVNHPDLKQIEPMQEASRAEVAALIYQALVTTGQAAAISSSFIVVPYLAAPSFSDIQGHWAADWIRGLGQQGLISGYRDGTFQPEAAMSRAQYAALMVKVFNPKPKRAAVSFTDVPADFWATTALQQAYQGELLSGFSNNTFRPNEPVLRAHVIVALVNALTLPVASEAVLHFYNDHETIPPYARNGIAAATQQGIVVNYPTQKQLNPNRNATRAEIAALVYQALVRVGRTPAINSPYRVVL